MITGSIYENDVSSPSNANSVVNIHVQEGQYGCDAVGTIKFHATGNHQYKLNCDNSGQAASGYIVYQSDDGKGGQLQVVYHDRFLNQDTGIVHGTLYSGADTKYGGSWKWDNIYVKQGCPLKSS